MTKRKPEPNPVARFYTYGAGVGFAWIADLQRFVAPFQVPGGDAEWVCAAMNAHAERVEAQGVNDVLLIKGLLGDPKR